MSLSKRFAIVQLIILGIAFITVMAGVVEGTYSVFSWVGLGLGTWLFFIAAFVVAIMQIIYGSKEKNGVALAAGIVGLIPIIGFVAMILNIIVLARKE